MKKLKKKIVFIAEPSGWGGCEMLLLDYLSFIDYSKVDIILVTTKDFFSKKINQDKLPVIVKIIPFEFKHSSLKKNLNFYLYLRTLKPVDKIIFFPGSFYVFNWRDFLIAFLVSKKEVYCVENSSPPKPHLEEKKRYFNFIPKLSLWWHKQNFFMRIRLIFCKRILTVSKEVKNRLVDWYGYSSRNITVAYPGIDLERFRPNALKRKEMRNKFGIIDDKVIILSTARLSKEKCLDRLIEAFENVSQTYENTILFFIGDGPERNRLERLVNESFFADRIKFLGYQERVEDFLIMSDIFVLTSNYEGFSLATVEAMACEVIPVRTDTCGAKEIITNGQDGFIVDCSTMGVREGLEKALALSAGQKRHMSMNARKTVEEKFELEKNIKLAITRLEPDSL